ncbi:hypothetical protein HK101_009195 [Irineochytrium annulatum]|nr:hypothetical protein HK101_009195 [Irineochytrium annulatum]
MNEDEDEDMVTGASRESFKAKAVESAAKPPATHQTQLTKLGVTCNHDTTTTATSHAVMMISLLAVVFRAVAVLPAAQGTVVGPVVTAPQSAPPLRRDQDDVGDCVSKLIQSAVDEGLLPSGTAGHVKSRRDVGSPEIINAPPAFARREDLIPPLAASFDRCLPLVSTNPVANPYHQLLTGMPIDQVVSRLGNGIPVPLAGGIHCAANTQPCPWSQSQQISITTGVSLGVTKGSESSYTATNASTWSRGTTENHIGAIAYLSPYLFRQQILDNSFSKANTSDDSFAQASYIQYGLTRTHFNQTASTHVHTDFGSTTNSLTFNHRDSSSTTHDDGLLDNSNVLGTDTTVGAGSSAATSNSEMNRRSVTVECKYSSDTGQTFEIAVETKATEEIPVGVSGSVALGFTHKDESSLAVTFTIGAGKGNSTTPGTSNSTVTFDTTTTGSHHNTRDSTGTVTSYGNVDDTTNGHGITNTTGFRRSVTDTYGQSLSHSLGTTTDQGTVDNRGGDIQSSSQATKSIYLSQINDTSTTNFIATTTTVYIQPGTCGIPVCMPNVMSVVTPWLCKNGIQGQVDIYASEIQHLMPYGTGGPNISCTVAILGCNDPILSFIRNENKYIYEPFQAGVLTRNMKSDGYLAPAGNFFFTGSYVGLRSTNGEYVLKFNDSGADLGLSNSNLYLLHFDTVVWQTGITNTYTANRFSITADGHLIQEAQGVYVNDLDAWSVVWSSLPIHLDYPVGVYGRDGYTLYLQNNGELELLDGAQAKIWSSKLSNLSLGFKYPVNSLWPSVYATEPNAIRQSDPHNAPAPNLTYLAPGAPVTRSCDGPPLSQDTAIVSPNGRFTLALRRTGNLVLKDRGRTMWESGTADLWYAAPPYAASFSAQGGFQVRDAGSHVLWETAAPGSERSSALQVTDDGDVAVVAADGSVVWSLRGDGGAPTVWTISRQPYRQCDPCRPCQAAVTAGPSPLVHLATKRCLSWTKGAMVPFAPGGCDGWVYDASTRYYRPSNDPSGGAVCLGIQAPPAAANGTAAITGPCQYGRAWRLYDDGLLTLANSANLCLGPAGTVVACDAGMLRVDKLWSFGVAGMTMASISTAAGRQASMMMGQSLAGPAGTSFQINPSGDLLVLHGSAYNVVRSNAKVVGPPLLRLGSDGSLSVTNLYGNVTYSKVAVASAGVGPFQLSIIKVGAVALQDSMGKTIWSLSV